MGAAIAGVAKEPPGAVASQSNVVGSTDRPAQNLRTDGNEFLVRLRHHFTLQGTCGRRCRTTCSLAIQARTG